MGAGDLGLLIGLPISITAFGTLLSSNGIGNLVIISLASIALAVVLAGISQYLSGAEISIFGTGIKLPDITGWWLRFMFIGAFLGTFYTGNILAGLSLYSSMPYFIGAILVTVLSGMFIFGIMAFSSGTSSGGN